MTSTDGADNTPTPTNHTTQNAKAYYTSHQTATELGRAPDADEKRSRWHRLNRRSDSHPVLDQLMDDALMTLILTADGSTTSLAQKVTDGSGGGTKVPQSALGAEIAEIQGEYTGARCHAVRLTVIKRAQDLCMSVLYAPDRSKIKGTLEWKQAIAADPRSCRAIEAVYGVSKSTVARLKQQFGDS